MPYGARQPSPLHEGVGLKWGHDHTEGLTTVELYGRIINNEHGCHGQAYSTIQWDACIPFAGKAVFQTLCPNQAQVFIAIYHPVDMHHQEIACRADI
jgi:hypothetical protein